MYRAVCPAVEHRCRSCLPASGGHFEYLTQPFLWITFPHTRYFCSKFGLMFTKYTFGYKISQRVYTVFWFFLDIYISWELNTVINQPIKQLNFAAVNAIANKTNGQTIELTIKKQQHKQPIAIERNSQLDKELIEQRPKASANPKAVI